MIHVLIPKTFTQSKSAYFPVVKTNAFGKLLKTNNNPKNNPVITLR